MKSKNRPNAEPARKVPKPWEFNRVIKTLEGREITPDAETLQRIKTLSAADSPEAYAELKTLLREKYGILTIEREKGVRGEIRRALFDKIKAREEKGEIPKMNLAQRAKLANWHMGIEIQIVLIGRTQGNEEEKRAQVSEAVRDAEQTILRGNHSEEAYVNASLGIINEFISRFGECKLMVDQWNLPSNMRKKIESDPRFQGLWQNDKV